jgi:TatD DNase family protein
MELFDTHCHIHEADPEFTFEGESRSRWRKAGILPDDIIDSAKDAGVTRIICVGTTLTDSGQAVQFVRNRPGCWASIGIHPHEAKNYTTPHSPRFQGATLEILKRMAGSPKVVAVGECGLDFYYNHSPKADQEKVLRFQIELALENNLPVIFHVRDAFEDFWPIFDDYKGIRGVIHSFSANQKELDEILGRNLYVGLNGIMTFTKNHEQLAAAKSAPLDKIVLETDAPFLTPAPERGTICEPKHVRVTAQFLANLRGETLKDFAVATTRNAQHLFGLD